MSFHSESNSAFLRRGLDVEVKDFAVPSASNGSVPIITDVQPIASYSWIDAATPTIAVPSSPSVWKSQPVRSVPPDSGRVFVDQNASRMLGFGSPLLPIFAAIEDMHGKDVFDYTSLDFITDRNNLRKLLRWVTGTVDKGFRIDIDVAGRTCIFSRCEEKVVDRVVGFRGYGHEYEKAATSIPRGSEGATGHHRIISLKFGQQRILLRCEIDACTDNGSSGSSVDGIEHIMAGLSFTEASSSRPFGGIVVRRTPSRTLAPQSSLIELKTRAAHKPLDWVEVYPQLFLSQTAYLYLANHSRGIFTPAVKYKLDDATLRAQASQARPSMTKLDALLKDIKRQAMKLGEGTAMSLVCESDNLRLYKRRAGTGATVDALILEYFK